MRIQTLEGEFAQNTTAREALQKGLAEIFNPTDTGNNFTFQDSKGQIINIPYTALLIFVLIRIKIHSM